MSDDLQEEHEPQENPNMKQLREKAKRADEAEARAGKLERDLAFAKAGLDLSDPRVEKYFVPGYDGDLDPSKIREAAEKDGFLQAPEKPQVPTEEQQAIQRISDAADGGEPPNPPTVENDMRSLVERGERENWDPDRFSMELANLAQRSGMPTALDGQPFVPTL